MESRPQPKPLCSNNGNNGLVQLFRGRLRRVGNSLSVLVPKKALEDLHRGEGDEVEVAILPPAPERRARLQRAIGSVPGLAPFRRERKDRF